MFLIKQTVFIFIIKDCTLYAIQLDGFSHCVYYKDANGDRHIAYYSGYATHYEAEHKCFRNGDPANVDDYAYVSWNEDKTKVLFLGYPHSSFQHNAQELVYQDRSNW